MSNVASKSAPQSATPLDMFAACSALYIDCLIVGALREGYLTLAIERHIASTPVTKEIQS